MAEHPVRSKLRACVLPRGGFRKGAREVVYLRRATARRDLSGLREGYCAPFPSPAWRMCRASEFALRPGACVAYFAALRPRALGGESQLAGTSYLFI